MIKRWWENVESLMIKKDTIAMIPDRAYTTRFQTVIDDCKEHGALDVTTIGTVPNVGLLSQKLERVWFTR